MKIENNRDAIFVAHVKNYEFSIRGTMSVCFFVLIPDSPAPTLWLEGASKGY